MLYIFDGGDLCGKTTIAKAFAERINAPYVKKNLEVLKYQNRKILAKDNIELIQKFFWEIIYSIGKVYNLVIDRSLLSSIVYSIIFNRHEDLSYIYKLFNDPNFHKHIALFFVNTDEESLTNRYNSRGENLFSLEELISNQSVFEKTVKTFNKTKKVIYEINNNDGINIKDIVQDLIIRYYR